MSLFHALSYATPFYINKIRHHSQTKSEFPLVKSQTKNIELKSEVDVLLVYGAPLQQETQL